MTNQENTGTPKNFVSGPLNVFAGGAAVAAGMAPGFRDEITKCRRFGVA